MSTRNNVGIWDFCMQPQLFKTLKSRNLRLACYFTKIIKILIQYLSVIHCGGGDRNVFLSIYQKIIF